MHNFRGQHRARCRSGDFKIGNEQDKLHGRIDVATHRRAIHFGDGVGLTYLLESDAAARTPRARYAADVISVVLPAAIVRRWADSNEVSIEGEQALDGGETLRILVEKDFACLQPRPGEDESDMFPNPDASTKTC